MQSVLQIVAWQAKGVPHLILLLRSVDRAACIPKTRWALPRSCLSPPQLFGRDSSCCFLAVWGVSITAWATRGLQTSTAQATSCQASLERWKFHHPWCSSPDWEGGCVSLMVLQHLSLGLARSETAPLEKERVAQSCMLSSKTQFWGVDLFLESSAPAAVRGPAESTALSSCNSIPWAAVLWRRAGGFDQCPACSWYSRARQHT